jgi:hypothetical protein
MFLIVIDIAVITEPISSKNNIENIKWIYVFLSMVLAAIM